MTFKKVAYWLHLWIGMVSGIIVFIVCITGAIWALNIYGWVGEDKLDDIKIESNSRQLLKPSQLSEIAEDILGVKPTYVSYAKDAPVRVGSYGKGKRVSALLDPYDGTLIDGQDLKLNEPKGKQEFNFWNFIRQGHRALWLPWDIGRPIVNYGTLSFVIVLITGLVIWFPKSKKAAKNRLWFNWKKNTSTKRKLFDLHSVLGFYICFILLAIACTGMVWGLNWWSEGLYKMTSGGKDLPEWGATQSDTLRIDTAMTPAIGVDYIFDKLMSENPSAQGFSFNYPDEEDNASTISATVSPEKDVYYNSDRYTFDRYSLKEITVDGPYSGKYKDASFADKLRRMNYEIHIGTIGGTPGRLLAFFGALFGASLPLTGFYIFFKTRVGKKRKKRTA